MPIAPFLPRAAAATVAALLVAAGLHAAGGPDTPAAPAQAQAAAPAPPRISSRLTETFSVLRRPRDARDSLGGRTDGMPESDYHGALVRRLADAAPTGDALPRISEGFVAPGPRDTLCLLMIAPGFAGPGGTCVPAAEAIAGDLVLAVGAGGDLVEVSGLVPDGVATVTLVTTDDTTARLPVVGNAYAAVIGAAPAEVRFRDPSGHLHRVAFGAGG